MSQLATDVSAVLDIDGLLAPIPGADPSGDPHAYAYGLREQLSELRIEERPEDFDDATRPEKLKKADWPRARQLAEQALRDQSKDLRIACHLVEAVTKLDGFSGLRDGLILVRRLVDECWDFLLPDIDDGDLDNRAAPLANMLDDPVRGMCFPNTVRSIGLLGDGAGLLSYLDWDRLRTGHDGQASETLRAPRPALRRKGCGRPSRKSANALTN